MERKECLIVELRKLKESSREAVENLNTFSEFKNYIHVKRRVQNELFALIEEADKSNKSQLILVCGGVGDGKSHLISYFINKYPNIMRNFQIHNDATESLYPQKTSIDTLNDILQAFNDKNIERNFKKIILVINLGVLNNFIDSEYKNNFKRLREYVIRKGILDSTTSTNSFDKNSNFQYINFSDYHMYSLSNGSPRSEYIENIINKIIQNHEDNVFYKSYINNCSSCGNRYMCPIKLNYEMLKKDSVKLSLSSLLIESMVKYKNIVSTRSLLNFIYDFIVNNNLDNMNIKELNKKLSDLSADDYIKYIFVNNIFNHSELSNILSFMSTLDPINVRNEELDDLIIRLNITDDMNEIFKAYLKLESNNYLSDIIMNKEILKEAFERESLKSKRELLKYNLIKTFIRLYLFIPDNKDIVLEDSVYIQYMKDLYNWNKGSNRDLKRIYDDVKSSIYKWNGEATKGNINIFIGKSQMRFRISQKLNIDADISNIPSSHEEVLYKFSPNLIFKFKNEEKNTSHEIDIDFNLYSLLMKINDGYRPNKSDKYNYINFVEFINKIIKLGSQSKEIEIEDRSGSIYPRYKLSYDTSFESYKFERVK